MAGGSSSRPDTLMQTGSAANLDKPPCRRDGPYVFESLDGPLVLSWMTGPRTDVGEAEFLEELSDIARMKVDAEPLGDDAFEVEPTPAHDAVLLTIRTRLDDLRELSQLLRGKKRLGPSVQLSTRPSGPDPWKRWTQSRSVWRSIPPIFAAEPRSMPSRTAASDRSRRLWLTFFHRRASPRHASAE